MVELFHAPFELMLSKSILLDCSASKSQEPLPTSAHIRHIWLPRNQQEIQNLVVSWRSGSSPFHPSPPHPARVGLHVSWCSQRFCRSSPRLLIPSQSSAGTLFEFSNYSAFFPFRRRPRPARRRPLFLPPLLHKKIGRAQPSFSQSQVWPLTQFFHVCSL